MIRKEDQLDAIAGLNHIVEEFNTKFNKWMEETKCRANFGWNYDEKQIKGLVIQSIDIEVYRKPPPEGLQRFTLGAKE